MEENVSWEEEQYILSDFLKKRSLPQLVKVVVGYDGGDSDTCLDEEQIITINEVPEAGSIVSEDENRQRLFIPRSCEQKVEVLMQGATRSYYETVGELCEVLPKYVRVFPESSKTHKRNLCRSFKLTLIGITKKRKYLECQNQNGVRCCLPMSLQARFVPLQDGQEYFVHEVIDVFKMPVMVQFINSKYENSAKDSAIFNTSCGVLTLLEVLKEDTVVYSTENQNSGNKSISTFTIPKTMALNIIVIGEQRAAVNEDVSMQFAESALSDRLESSKEDSILDDLESEDDYTPLQYRDEYMYLLMIQNGASVAGVVTPKLPLKTVYQNEVILLNAFHESTDNVCEAKSSSSTKLPDDICLENGQASDSGNCATRKDEGDSVNLFSPRTPGVQNVNGNIPLLKSLPKDARESEAKTQNMPHGSEYVNLPLSNVESVYAKAVSPKPPPKPNHSNSVTALLSTMEANEVTKSNLNDSSLVAPLEVNLYSKVKKEEIKDKLTSELKAVLPAAARQQDIVNFSSLSVGDVVELLTKNHLSEFADAFRSNMIDGELLMQLDRNCLQSLGLNNFQATKLQMLIKGWHPKTK